MTQPSPRPQQRPPQEARLAANSVNRLVVRDVPNVLVFVGGTVDPGNTTSATHSRGYARGGGTAGGPYWGTDSKSLAQRKLDDPDWYWFDNEKMRAAVARLRERYTNLHVFTAHGWSGDNSPRNREVAGAYLADRLCGGNGEPAYYAAWKKREVSFHLIGHSHGGNVINELTRRVAESKDWPATWKIRSVTYLSTPFFRRLHPVKTGGFHADCRVINVFNQYDITQRVIADFSLKSLTDLLTLGGISELTAQLAQLHFDGELFNALKPVGLEDRDDSWTGVDLQLMLDPAKAARLYDACIGALEQLGRILDKAEELLVTLHTGIEYDVASELAKKIKPGRSVLSEALLVRFVGELERLREGARPTLAAFRKRRAGSVYTLAGFFEDVHVAAFVDPLLRFLDVDVRSLEGPLTGLIHDVLAEQIDTFDDTTASPAAQLAGTPFAARITQVDVTKEDTYFGTDASRHYPGFISRLEGIERRYATGRQRHDLLDLAFTLLAQLEPLRGTVAEWGRTATRAESALAHCLSALEVTAHLPALGPAGTAAKAARGMLPFFERLTRLAHVVGRWVHVFAERDAGGLVDPNPTFTPRRGDLAYLTMKSHSVSRQELYEPVERALTAQLDTRPRRAKR